MEKRTDRSKWGGRVGRHDKTKTGINTNGWGGIPTGYKCGGGKRGGKGRKGTKSATGGGVTKRLLEGGDDKLPQHRNTGAKKTGGKGDRGNKISQSFELCGGGSKKSKIEVGDRVQRIKRIKKKKPACQKGVLCGKGVWGGREPKRWGMGRGNRKLTKNSKTAPKKTSTQKKNQR